jgi:hypothetical protein
MFGTIRRHQKWLWIAIIGVIIPSFVIFFSPDATLGRRRSGDYGSMHGRPISYEQFATAYRESELLYLFRFGDWPSRDEVNRQLGFDLEREARNRVLLIDKLREQKVHVSVAAAAQWVKQMFQDPRQRVFRLDSYNQLIKEKLPEKGLQESDFDRFAMNQVGIQTLISVFGLNGRFVTPREAELHYRREHEQFESEAVVYSMSNFLAGITVTTNALNQYFTNRLAVYRLPDRVQVRYVQFELTNFWAEADEQMAKQTNLALILNAIYQRQGANFYVDTNGNVLPEAAAKERIKERLRKDFAMQGALKKAGAFAETLYDMKPRLAENLDKLAATNQYQVRVTEPFSEYDLPKDMRVLESFARAAFALTDEEPLAEPVVGEDGVYLMALHKKIPSEIPPLDSILARVTEDFRRSQALAAARQAGDNFYRKLTNDLAQGKTFAAVCGQAKVGPLTLPKFSLSTRSLPDLDDRLDLSTLKDLVINLTPGKTSQFVPTRDGGFVLHLKGRLPAEEATLKKELPEYLKALRQERQFDAYEDWLNREIRQARLSEPVINKPAEKK